MRREGEPVAVGSVNQTASWVIEGNQYGAIYGISVASAGDVNGDGYSDAIVGADLYNNGQEDEGRAFVYYGSASGLATTAAWTTEGNMEYARTGYSVASAGDVNGDGFSDVVVGAPTFDNRGRAFVFHGSPTGLGTIQILPAQGTNITYFGYSVASAGDVNGDGFSDVVVGAYGTGDAYLFLGSASGVALTPAWTVHTAQLSSVFAETVASAGDVNDDGYSDVLVTAHYYNNGEPYEGRVFLYHGSAAGLGTTAAWTGESNQANAAFGQSAASAGDVNGDGFSDVIIGADAFSNGELYEGRAFVYLGSPTGLGANAAWTAENDDVDSDFGYSAASAGDVNADGFDDVIVGARHAANGESFEGLAYVYLGSATGLASSPTWTAEGNYASGYFGETVASAGDVNGDGASDVIVGTPGFMNGEYQEGRASLFHGVATGGAGAGGAGGGAGAGGEGGDAGAGGAGNGGNGGEGGESTQGGTAGAATGGSAGTSGGAGEGGLGGESGAAGSGDLGGEGGTSGTGGGTSRTGGTGGLAGAAAGAAGTAGASGNGGKPGRHPSSDDDSGCGCRVGRQGAFGGDGGALLAIFLVLLRRRGRFIARSTAFWMRL